MIVPATEAPVLNVLSASDSTKVAVLLVPSPTVSTAPTTKMSVTNATKASDSTTINVFLVPRIAKNVKLCLTLFNVYNVNLGTLFKVLIIYAKKFVVMDGLKFIHVTML